MYKRGWRRQEIFDEIMAKNFPKLDKRFQFKWIHRELIKTYLKKKNPTPRHITMKCKNFKDKQQVPTGPRERSLQRKARRATGLWDPATAAGRR